MPSHYYNAVERMVAAYPRHLTKNVERNVMADSELPYKEIYINHHGKTVTVLVDAEDYPLLSRHTWYIRSTTYPNNPYAATTLPIGRGKQKKENLRIVAMHYFIMGVGNIDHKSLNTLDNRKQNLRKATMQQNNVNRPPMGFKNGKKCSSQYKGVQRSGNKWKATIGFNRKTIALGSYEKEEDAARAYNVKAKELFGEFAWLNPV